jgi:hypothetical protein
MTATKRTAKKTRPKPPHPRVAPGLAPAPVPLPAAPLAVTGAPTWTTRKVRLGDLMPWPRNPRRINDAQSARLLNSFDEFGQVELIALGPNNEVYNGHQRLKVLAGKYGPDYELEARVCSRELTELEREKLTIYLHRGAAGEFDLEILLKEFDPIKLDEWGMPDFNIPDVAEDEWKEMPEFDGSARVFAKVSVAFSCAEDIAQFSALIGQAVTTQTKSIWFPAAERRDLISEQWAADEAPAEAAS